MHFDQTTAAQRDPVQGTSPAVSSWRTLLSKAVMNYFKVTAMFDTAVLAGFVLAALIYFSGLSNVTSPVFWTAVAPLVYLLWVVVFLAINGMATALTLHLYPKPRSLVGSITNPSYRSLTGAGACYVRWSMVRSLPLINCHLGGCRWLRRFVMRSYSGKVLCDKALLLGDFPYDPDLTEIGEGTVIGGEATLTSHAFNMLPDGRPTYACAMIKIGKNVTIGAGSRVEMGCQIGDGAALEPGSVLAPFSLIGPNEIWSGVPATFRRMRTTGWNQENGESKTPSQQLPVHSVPLVNGHSHKQQIVPSPADYELAKGLVRSALGARPENSEWDSLDQMAIALAIHTQTGLPMAAGDIFKLRTIDQVAASLSEGKPSHDHLEIHRDQPSSRLPENPELLPLLNRREVSRLLGEEATRADAGRQLSSLKNLPIRIAASFTADFLQQPIERWARQFGIEAEVQFAGFNQIPQSLLDPGSLFSTNAGGLNVVLVAAEDLPSQNEVEYIQGLLEAVEVFLNNPARQSRLCLSTMPVFVSGTSTGRHESIEQARLLWNSRIAQFQDVDVIAFGRIIESLGTAASYDAQLHQTASCPYSMDALNECGIEIVRAIRKSVRPRAKVIAVDCDNTLWGGVVGEAGLTGIDLGNGPHGKFHLSLQRWIQAKKEEGVLIAIVSRNEEADVWDVFENHSEMVLRRNDIVAHRVNWLPKSQNLKSLAEELNLGLDSFVFLDDDPAVRLEVATSLPEVTVVPLEQPDQFVGMVEKLWAFDVLNITSDDRRRTEMMLAERDRKVSQDRHHTLEDYLAGLQLRVEVKEAEESDLPRVAQLIQKTNQFNLSTIRRTLEEVKLLTDARILAISVADRFGDYGSVGVVILRSDNGTFLLDTFLLSCRVLGRHVENAVIAATREICIDQGALTLQAIVAETPRNEPARQFVTDAGFTSVTPHLWEWDLSTSYLCPAQIDLSIQLRDGSRPRDQKAHKKIAAAHA